MEVVELKYLVSLKMGMKKILVFSILLLSAIAVTLGTTITTTIQIQPAYSQAQHCSVVPGFFTCVTPGQNPSQCSFFIGQQCSPSDITNQQAGQRIGNCHRADAQGPSACVVVPPKDQR